MAIKKQPWDTIDSKELKRTAKKASLNAKRISAALGLPITVISDGVLTQQLPDGRVVEIKKVVKVNPNKATLKKGTVLCLK